MIYSKNTTMTTSQVIYQSAETLIGNLSSDSDIFDDVYPLLLEMETYFHNGTASENIHNLNVLLNQIINKL